MRDSACRWCIVKKKKHFEVLVNIFEFSRVWGSAVSWLVYAYASKFSWIFTVKKICFSFLYFFPLVFFYLFCFNVCCCLLVIFWPYCPRIWHNYEALGNSPYISSLASLFWDTWPRDDLCFCVLIRDCYKQFLPIWNTYKD